MRILPLLILSGAALASSGDRLDSFNTCVSGCLSSCTTSSVPLYLRILRWDCASECRYDCSHVLTDAADRGEEGYHQFFGKWAFTRMLGMQEPASVMFSIGNIIPHLRGFKQAQRLPHANGLRPWLMLAAAIQINTWIWSAVFHTRGEWTVESGSPGREQRQSRRRSSKWLQIHCPIPTEYCADVRYAMDGATRLLLRNGDNRDNAAIRNNKNLPSANGPNPVGAAVASNGTSHSGGTRPLCLRLLARFLSIWLPRSVRSYARHAGQYTLDIVECILCLAA